MKTKSDPKKIIGVIGALLFALSMTINQTPPKAYASSSNLVITEAMCGPWCDGGVQSCGKCDQTPPNHDQ